MRKEALLGAVATALLAVGPAHAATGGASVPVAGSPAGGASVGVVRDAPVRGGPKLAAFSLSRTRIYAYGAAARVAFRIDGRARAVPVTVAVYRDRVRVATLRVGS